MNGRYHETHHGRLALSPPLAFLLDFKMIIATREGCEVSLRNDLFFLFLPPLSRGAHQSPPLDAPGASSVTYGASPSLVTIGLGPRPRRGEREREGKGGRGGGRALRVISRPLMRPFEFSGPFRLPLRFDEQR